MDKVDTYSLTRVSRRRDESKESDQDRNVFRRERGNRGREMRIILRILFNIVLDGAGDLVRLRLTGRMISQRKRRLRQQFNDVDEAKFIKRATKSVAVR